MALSPQARPWESSLFYDVRVDGETFVGITEFGSPGAPIAPGRTHHGRGSARLAVICGPARNPFGPPQAVHYASGLREGEHDVVFRARVAASEAWIETAPLRVTLRCPPAPVDAGSALDAAISTDGGVATDGGVVTDRGFAADGDAAPDGGRGVDAGGGCSASPRGARGGGVDCWGFNGNHALGNGEVSGNRATPGPVWGLDDVTLLAPGPCARRASGEWLCWGGTRRVGVRGSCPSRSRG